MDPTRDSRYNLNYSMSIGLSMGENPDIYGNSNPALTRPTTGLGQSMNRGSAGSGLMSTNTQCGPMSNSRGIKRTNSDCFDDRAMGSQTLSQLDNCGGGGVPDVVDDSYTSLQKKSPPANGKKTKGRVKIKMEYIDNKLRRYTTFSKRKTGIMKKVSANSVQNFNFVQNHLSFCCWLKLDFHSYFVNETIFRSRIHYTAVSNVYRHSCVIHIAHHNKCRRHIQNELHCVCVVCWIQVSLIDLIDDEIVIVFCMQHACHPT